MNTEAQRRASAEFVAKRKAAGWRKVTFWISPGVWEELERLKAVHGTRDKALEALIARAPASEQNRPDGIIPVTKADLKALGKSAASKVPGKVAAVKSRLKGEWKAP